MRSHVAIIAENGGAIHVHNDTPALSVTSSRSYGKWAPALALIAAVGALVSPRATPLFLPLLGAAILTLARPLMSEALRPSPLLIALGAMCAYLCINSLWAVEPLEGLGRAALFGAIVVMASAVTATLAKAEPADCGDLQRALIIAIGTGALFLAIETPFAQPIRRTLGSLLPFLRPAPKHMTVAKGWVEHIQPYTLNRNMAVLVLLLWPTFLLLKARLAPVTARMAGAALLVLSAVAIFKSEHETSMLAIVASCLVYAGMHVAAPVMRALVLAGWIAATMLVVPLAAYSYQAGLHQAKWLPGTARNRIVLWSVTVERMRESPILGIGIGSTKPLDEEAAPTAETKPGDSYPQRTGRHSHNIFMQTWFELGAAGALLLLAIGVMGLRVLARLPAGDQPYAYASFVAATVIASFSWGMWQPWFMCLFGMWALVLLVGLSAGRRHASAPS